MKNILTDFKNYLTHLEKEDTQRNKLLAYFIPVFYLIMLMISYFFNLYSTVTIIEIAMITAISLFIAAFYSVFSRSIILYITPPSEDKEKTEKQSRSISAKTVFLPVNILVVILFFGIFTGFTISFTLSAILVAALLFCLVLFFVYIAIQAATKINQDAGIITRARNTFVLLLLLLLNPLIYFSYVPLKSEFVDIKRVTSTDMQPGITKRNIVLIDKTSGLIKRPRQKEILWVKSPLKKQRREGFFDSVQPDLKMKNLTYFRRVVGHPGDTIEIIPEKGTFINGEVIEEPYVEKDKGLLCQLVLYCKETTIPKKHYFVLGDNRNSSQDSRIWGPVHKSNFKGRVAAIIWPAKDFKVLP